jgi:hypothetical protein
MIRLEWSVEQEVDFIYIVYFVTDRFGMGDFFNYIFVDMCSARGASSSTSATSISTWSTSTSDFVFGVHYTTTTGLRLMGLRRLPCRH